MTKLKNPSQFIGFQGASISPNVVLLGNHGLHIEIYFDPNHFLGKTDTAGISDVILESALTTIIDCENSVAAVDADEKVITRTLDENRIYISADGGEVRLQGRFFDANSNIGHLMDSALFWVVMELKCLKAS